MMKLLDAFKQYIAKHSRGLHISQLRENMMLSNWKEVFKKLPKEVVLGMEAEDLMRIQDFITVSKF